MVQDRKSVRAESGSPKKEQGSTAPSLGRIRLGQVYIGKVRKESI